VNETRALALERGGGCSTDKFFHRRAKALPTDGELAKLEGYGSPSMKRIM